MLLNREIKLSIVVALSIEKKEKKYISTNPTYMKNNFKSKTHINLPSFNVLSEIETDLALFPMCLSCIFSQPSIQ